MARYGGIEQRDKGSKEKESDIKKESCFSLFQWHLTAFRHFGSIDHVSFIIKNIDLMQNWIETEDNGGSESEIEGRTSRRCRQRTEQAQGDVCEGGKYARNPQQTHTLIITSYLHSKKLLHSLHSALFFLRRTSKLQLISPLHLLIVCISVSMHIYTHYVHLHVHWCMHGLELDALHLGPGRSYVLITWVSIKLDYFPRARMHDSSILIDHCLGTSVIVWVCVLMPVGEWEDRAIC